MDEKTGLVPLSLWSVKIMIKFKHVKNGETLKEYEVKWMYAPNIEFDETGKIKFMIGIDNDEAFVLGDIDDGNPIAELPQ